MSTRTFTIGVTLAAALLAGAPPAGAEDHRKLVDSKPEECTECHQGSGVMANHGQFWNREHRVQASRSTANCEECHSQAYCLDCHKGGALSRRTAASGRQGSFPASTTSSSLSSRGESMPGSHGPDFVSTHSMKAADDPRSCARCHDSRTFCNDCHEKQQEQNGGIGVKPHAPVWSAPGVLDTKWVSDHRGEARRNLQSCQACHQSKSDCSNFACHPGLSGR